MRRNSFLSCSSSAALWILAASGSQAQLRWEHVPLFEGRHGHAAALDEARGRLVVFGGRNFANLLLGETWEWNGTVWQKCVSEVAPPPREFHAMVWDAVRQRVLLFGGRGASGNLGDTWEWDGAAWTLRATALAPAARAGHAMAWDSVRGRAVLFAGSLGSGLADDTWEWDGASWTQLHPAHSPPRRSGAAMTFVAHRGRALIVSGFCPFGGPCYYRDAWEWDGQDWTPAPGEFTGPGRTGHQLAYDRIRERAVFFGGSDEPSHYYDDTWEWDGATWKELQLLPRVPGRERYAMVFDPAAGHVVLTGGIGWWGATYGDVWTFSGGDRWNRLQEGTPPARESPALAFDAARGRAVMFGGIYGFRETWEFDGTAWHNPEPAVSPPNAAWAQMAFDPEQATTWLFPGFSSGDLWGWDGTTWRRVKVNTVPPGVEGHALVWEGARRRLFLLTAATASLPSETFVFEGTDWRRLEPAHTPPPRAYHALAYDAARDRIVLFGGQRGLDVLRDTWEWDGEDWRELSPTLSPPARWRHRLVHDDARGRTVLLGCAGSSCEVGVWEWDGATWVFRATAAAPGYPLLLGAAYDPGRREVITFAGVWPETWRLAPEHAAQFEAFGHGCPGQNGTPALAARAGALPWLGDTFEVELGNLPPGPFCLLLLGTSRTRWGAIDLPARLDHLGMAGCELFVSGDVLLPVPAGGGRARAALAIPTDPALAGADFFMQSWQIDCAANPGCATVSNPAVATLGAR
jgi:hypothetical protein